MTLQFGPQVDLGFVDKRRSSGQKNTTPLGTSANYKDEASLDTRLAALGYSAQNLRIMNTNDKVFALRQSDDNAGV